MAKITIFSSFYDDMFDEDWLADERSFLFDEYGEQEGWETEEDVPEQWLEDDAYDCNDREWDEIIDKLKNIFSDPFIWDAESHSFYPEFKGDTGGYDITEDIDYVLYDRQSSLLQDCDQIRISDIDGEVVIEGIHHDGKVHYVGHRLTNLGWELYDGWNYSCLQDVLDYEKEHGNRITDITADMADGQFFATLFDNPKYSEKPYVAKEVGYE